MTPRGGGDAAGWQGGGGSHHAAMRLLAACCACVLLLSVAGCDSEREIFRANPTAAEDPDAAAVGADLAALAKGADSDDPAASAAYDKAVSALILRGGRVETRVIDALRSSTDAWVRIGCVEVLTAIASKASIEHFIAVLDDAEPLVAHRANIALATLLGERMVAEAGKPAAPGQLPAVPARAEDDLDMRAEERIWAAWHRQHGADLKAAWQRWWAANREKATLR